MAYAVEADLNLSPERLVELTESASATGVKDQAVVDKLHVRATGRIDAALLKRYVTPVAIPFPEILTDVEASIWKRLLYQHREVMDTPKDVLADYEWAMAQLELWRTGGEPIDAPTVGAWSLFGVMTI